MDTIYIYSIWYYSNVLESYLILDTHISFVRCLSHFGLIILIFPNCAWDQRMEEAKGKERSLELPGLQTRIDVLLETVQQSSPVRVQQLTLKHTHTQNWLLPALAGGGVVANPRKNKKNKMLMFQVVHPILWGDKRLSLFRMSQKALQGRAWKRGQAHHLGRNHKLQVYTPCPDTPIYPLFIS